MEEIEKSYTEEKNEIEGYFDDFLKQVIQASEKSKNTIFEKIDQEQY